MRDDLQELVDEVSRLLAAPATLEDADFTLLAFCAHDDSRAEAMDAVRTRSILTRGSPPATRAWFEEFGIAAAEAPLRTPADEAAGILTRLVIPVRHAGRTRGYLWLLDGGRIDPDGRRRPRAGRRRGARRRGRAAARRARRRPTRTSAGRSPRRSPAASRPRRRRSARWPAFLGEHAAQVLVALAPGRPGCRPGGGSRRRARSPPRCEDGAGRRPGPAARPRPTCARPAPWRRRRSPACRRAARPGCPAVRSGGQRALPAQWAQARAAARVAAAECRGCPRWRTGQSSAPGGRSAELPGPDPVVVPLLADPVLTETAEVFLDAPGSASRAAAALQIHRQTLYYRLARIEELTGLDLADGEARLLLPRVREGGPLSPRLTVMTDVLHLLAHRNGGGARVPRAHPRPARPRARPLTVGRRAGAHARLLAGAPRRRSTSGPPGSRAMPTP